MDSKYFNDTDLKKIILKKSVQFNTHIKKNKKLKFKILDQSSPYYDLTWPMLLSWM